MDVKSDDLLMDVKPSRDGTAPTLNDGLGVAVLIDGVVVAWFANFTEEARQWCTENHFGRWLVWRAKTPEIIPLTDDEYEEAVRKAAELSTLFEAQ